MEMASGGHVAWNHHTDSEDSDNDTAISAQNPFAQVLRYEMDVAKYYKVLREDLASLTSGKSSRRPVKSKSVQTEPEIPSEIPPSWVIAIHELSNDLHTRVVNMINKLYHTPSGYCKDGVPDLERVVRNMKYFSYKDGFWQSSLIPHIKIPAFWNRQFNSEDLKKELSCLVETSGKLRDLLPHVVECDQASVLKLVKTDVKVCDDKRSRDAEAVSTEAASGDVPRDLPDISSCVHGSDRWHFNFGPKAVGSSDCESVKSGYSSQPSTSGYVCKPRAVKGGSVPVKSGGQGFEPKPDQGIVVSKYSLRPHQRSISQVSVPKITAPKKLPAKNAQLEKVAKDLDTRSGLIIVGGKISRSTRKPLAPVVRSDDISSGPSTSDRKDLKAKTAGVAPKLRRGKSDLGAGVNDQENRKRDQNVPASNNVQKNFIKRNILALRAPVIRASTRKSKYTQMKI